MSTYRGFKPPVDALSMQPAGLMTVTIFNHFPLQCEPILEASYSTVMYTGRMGTAMIPKVMSNMLCCAQVVAMGEILMTGKGMNSRFGFQLEM